VLHPYFHSQTPRQHSVDGKTKKGKGKGSNRSRSPANIDKKMIPCSFYFNKKDCKKGKDCPYSLSLSKPPIHLMDDLSAYPLKYLFVYLSLYLTPFYLCIRCSISVTVRQPVHLSV
jgi:hypothetical protein